MELRQRALRLYGAASIIQSVVQVGLFLWWLATPPGTTLAQLSSTGFYMLMVGSIILLFTQSALVLIIIYRNRRFVDEGRRWKTTDSLKALLTFGLLIPQFIAALVMLILVWVAMPVYPVDYIAPISLFGFSAGLMIGASIWVMRLAKNET